jgi:large subunit ribosomal protein L11
MKVKLIVEGGKMTPGPAVAQQLGPMGINLGKVISDVNEATKDFKGTKVPVELDVNGKTKEYEIKVFSPPVSELIKKELALDKGSGEPGTIYVGNLGIESIIGIAKTKTSDLLAKDLKAAVKLVSGTCVSLGVLIENKHAAEICKEIDGGKYSKEIEKEDTEVSEEKKKSLDAYFKNIKSEQDKKKKAEEAAKVEEEAKAKATAEAKPEQEQSEVKATTESKIGEEKKPQEEKK